MLDYIDGAYVAGTITLLVLDRFTLRRQKVKILQLQKSEDDSDYIKFSLSFFVRKRLNSCVLSYTLRDKKDPTTVFNGKPRPLDFSKKGTNSEYLLFNRKLLDSYRKQQNGCGEWILDVKITSSGSLINPLYKIFPITAHSRKEFDLG